MTLTSISSMEFHQEPIQNSTDASCEVHLYVIVVCNTIKRALVANISWFNLFKLTDATTKLG